MTLIQIKTKNLSKQQSALFEMGFRPFFIGAGLFAVVSMFLWMLEYSGRSSFTIAPLTSMQWHAHEMIFGYTGAVIAGFLLTGVANWTGVRTVHGLSLGVLFASWMGSRIFWCIGINYVHYAALLDLGFMLGTIYFVASPIVKTKQWRQLGILSKLTLLLSANLAFYAGVFDLLQEGIRWGIYGGLYLIIGLILTVGMRVMPPFIMNGVPEEVEIKNSWFLRYGLMVSFIIFTTNKLFFQHSNLGACVSLVLFVLTSRILALWYTHGIWSRPLLWSLYLSFVFIAVGFLFYTLSSSGLVSELLAIHAFAVGGIGIATVSMMARVSLGHTGRSIALSSFKQKLMLHGIVLVAVVRVGGPLIYPQLHFSWILSAQLLWILVFATFLSEHILLLIGNRVDGRPG